MVQNWVKWCKIRRNGTILGEICTISPPPPPPPLSSPPLRVPSALLGRLDYNQSGTLGVRIDLTVVAENDNRTTVAGFSGVGFTLSFHRIDVRSGGGGGGVVVEEGEAAEGGGGFVGGRGGDGKGAGDLREVGDDIGADEVDFLWPRVEERLDTLVIEGVDVTGYPIFQDTKVQKAIAFACKAHFGQFRKTGEPYVAHCIHTGKILAALVPSHGERVTFSPYLLIFFCIASFI
uniref:Uncharacterized protein n=1 Tax=Ananas comosus var. bracteatus TaxID=296719 RepID=A0A6V7Q8T1_ANACO|nr:unnamed protein product [Ananas comosus var. bracteatus]